MAAQQVRIPDIGTTDAVDVIEVCVKPGDQVGKDDPLIVLESDKATMEVPSPLAGTVQRVLVSVGQSVKQADAIIELETAAAEPKTAPAPSPAAPAPSPAAPAPSPAAPAPSPATPPSQVADSSALQQVVIPDLGTTDAVDVIEVTVVEGDTVQQDSTLAVLESDKATMEVPSSHAGVVSRVLLKVGDKVTQGSPVVELRVAADTNQQVATRHNQASAPQSPAVAGQATSPRTASTSAASVTAATTTATTVSATPAAGTSTPAASADASSSAHAGPAVRRLARELGVDLARVVASGPRQRILKEDVHDYVRSRLQAQGTPLASAAGAALGMGLPALPDIDFSAFGAVDPQPMSKLKRVAANNLHRSWLHIPHVTQFDEADITDLEAFRKAEGERLKGRDIKLTLLAFLVKACAAALREFPRFNASLSNDGETLILKQYCHIGIAVDTPNGLVVPVIRDADQKSLMDIASTLQQLSSKARDKKLTPADMQGGCFSISSLGGIGGTAFTPIVNWPEVAILGVSRAAYKPVYQAGSFTPRLLLPLSLSYDHRVIDGADAARFTSWLAEQLTDIRRLLL